jgi:ribosomal protein S18 acetylase RimI-like enzyme
MKLQPAIPENGPDIMMLINQAKDFLKENGVDQWQDGYPELSDIQQDISHGTGYILRENGQIAGYCCIDFDGEPAYDTLRGEWPDNGLYAVIHRMAVDTRVKGRGLARSMFDEAEKMALSKQVHSIRVDTDDENKIMKHLLQALGFTYCGTIWFASSVKIAFQKSI